MPSAAFGKLRFELESLKAEVNTLAHLAQDAAGNSARFGVDRTKPDASGTRETAARCQGRTALSSELCLVQLKVDELARSVDVLQDEQRRWRGY